MFDSAVSARLRPFLAVCLLLGACSSSTITAGTGGSAGTLGLGCTSADQCDTGLCVIGETSSFCTQECAADADCPSAMYCAWIYPSSTGRCDPLANASSDCANQCDSYHALARVSAEVVTACSQACGVVTTAQAGAFVACSGQEMNAASGTGCLGTLCAQAGLTCP
jgi:hypothetical protein